MHYSTVFYISINIFSFFINMKRFISEILKLDCYLEGNLLKRYPTGAAPATIKFTFQAPMFLSWTAPVASGTRLPQFLAASCSSSALFLRRTCLQAPFWRRPGRLGLPFGWFGVVFFQSFFLVFRAGARSREQRPDPMKTTVFTV